MGIPAYDTAKLARRLVDEYGYEQAQADGAVWVVHEMIVAAMEASSNGEKFTRGIPPYDTVNLARRLVDEYGYEQRQAEGAVWAANEMIVATIEAS